MLIKIEQKLRRLYEHAFFLNHILKYKFLKKLWRLSKLLCCISFSLKIYTCRLSKQDVLLINPYKFDYEKGVPIGIATIASCLQKYGIKTYLLDMNLNKINNKSLLFLIKKTKPLIIGIGTITCQVNEAYRLGRLIKKSIPEVTLVYGGVHPTFVTEEAFKECMADFVVTGEGEQTLLELFKTLKSRKHDFSKITGLAYKKKGIVFKNEPRQLVKNLNTLPFPTYYQLSLKDYNTDLHIHPYYKEVAVDLVESRGCPNNCAYCATPQLYHQNVRLKDAKNIFAEIKSLYLKHGMKYFHFHDDNFLLDRKRVLKFCKLIKENNLEIVWLFLTDINTLKRNMDILPRLAEAGCVSIELGIENADTKILNRLGRHQDINYLPKLDKAIKKAGIVPLYLFMSFLPGEDIDSIRKTSMLLDKLSRGKQLNAIDFLISVHTRFGFGLFANPYPGSKFFLTAPKEGMVLSKKWVEYYPFCLSFIPHSLLNDIPVKNKMMGNEKFKSVVGRFSKEILYNRTHNQVQGISVFPNGNTNYSEVLYSAFKLCDGKTSVKELCDSLMSCENLSIREAGSAIRILAMLGLVQSKKL